MNFESVFIDPRGRTSRAVYIGGLIPLLLVVALYDLLVKGRNADWCLVFLLYPAFVLHARRLHDLGHTAWLLLAPGGALAALLWLRLANSQSPLAPPVSWIALVVSAAFIIWSAAQKGQTQPNRFGAVAA